MATKLRSFFACILIFGALSSFAQAPNISYSSPQVLSASISASISPSNSGGIVTIPTAVAWGSGFSNPNGVAVDSKGNVYVADELDNSIDKIPSNDGPPVVIASGLHAPTGVAVDAAGNVYFVDGEPALKKIPGNGSPIVTISTNFQAPYCVTVAPSGNLYVGELSSGAPITKFPAGGEAPVVITHFNPGAWGIVVDAAENIYIADHNQGIYKIQAGGTTPALIYSINRLSGVAVDVYGNLYATSPLNTSVIKIPAGGGPQSRLSFGLNKPTGIAIDAIGRLYVTETGANDVKKITPGGYTISKQLPRGLYFNANTGVISGVPTQTSPATDYIVNAYNSSGRSTTTVNITVNMPPKPKISYTTPQTVFIGDTIGIYPINTGGLIPSNIPYQIGTFHITPSLTCFTVGRAAQEYYRNDGASRIAVDYAGNTYLIYPGKTTITEILASNAGTVILSKGISTPSGVGVDANGNLYIADSGSKTLKIMPFGTDSAYTIASGFSIPAGIAIDTANNIYVGDTGNNTIQKVPAGGGTPVLFASNITKPIYGAADISGNVYFGNSSAIYRIQLNNGQVVPISPIPKPTVPSIIGIGVDATSSLYFVYTDNVYLQHVVKAAYGGYSISPALPAGLTFINAFGEIYGIPTAASPATNYTVEGFNFAGADTTIINMTVKVKTKPNISYSSPHVYVNGQAIPPLSPVNTGGPVSGFYSISPFLPAGLNFDTSTGTISGTPTANSNSTSYTVIVHNNLGADTALVNIAVGTPVNGIILSWPTPLTYAVGQAISPLSPTSSGVAAAAYSTKTPIVLNAGFSNLAGMAVDKKGNIYLAEAGNNDIKKIPAGGGSPVVIGSGFSGPTGVAADTLGNVYVADNGNSAIKKIPAGGGAIVTVGSGFLHPYGIAIDGTGNIYVTDAGNNAVKRIAANGSGITTVGSGFSNPTGIAVDNAGNVYVADKGHNMLKEIPSSGGTATTTIGTGYLFLTNPGGVAVDGAGNIFIANTGQTSVKEVHGGVATNIGFGYLSPAAVAIDGWGNVYVADNGSTAATTTVKKVNPAGGYYISTFLPPGITFNTNTGILNGTPLVPTPAINYTVTAYNGFNTSNSAVVSIKVLSNNAKLANVQLSKSSLSPAFSPTTSSYTAAVGNTITLITVTPKSSDPNAGITVNGVAITSGTASGSINLNIGPNTVTIIVTAQDGVTTKTYTVTVSRAASNNAYLSALQLVNPTTAKTTVSGPDAGDYTASVANAITSIAVIPTSAVSTSTVKVNGTTVLSGATSNPISLSVGANTITTVVTAQDGVTTKTYVITVTRAATGINIPYETVSVSNPADHPQMLGEEVNVHQALSPNGDGINDFLMIDGIGNYPDNKLSIINRSGQLIFEAKGYDNSTKVFDGHSSKNGTKQLPGTYFYSLEYVVNGVTRHKTGFVVLKY